MTEQLEQAPGDHEPPSSADHTAEYARLLPWLMLSFTLGWLAFFGVLKLIVWAVS